jgi:hypothetical protein
MKTWSCAFWKVAHRGVMAVGSMVLTGQIVGMLTITLVHAQVPDNVIVAPTCTGVLDGSPALGCSNVYPDCSADSCQSGMCARASVIAVGSPCDDGNVRTYADRCQEDGSCVGTRVPASGMVPLTPLPPEMDFCLAACDLALFSCLSGCGASAAFCNCLCRDRADRACRCECTSPGSLRCLGDFLLCPPP